MEEKGLSLYIDAHGYRPVFTTAWLLGQNELPFARRRVSKGEIIFCADEEHRYTYHVEGGLIKLYLTSREGGVKTLFYHAAGTQFGFQGFKRDHLTRSTAVAVVDSAVLAIAYDDLIAFCDSHTEYYLAYIEYLFQIMNSQTREIASLSFESGTDRLAGLLNAVVEDGDPTVRYTIDELAEMIGAHRNTVSNALAALRRLGLVDPQPRPIVVRDPEGLRRYVEERG